MRLRDRIFEFFHPRDHTEDEEDKVYDVDEDGRDLYEDDIIRYVFDEVTRRKNERQPFEQQWVLNSNFLFGNQYTDISSYGDVNVEQILPDDDGLSHEVFNNIAPLIETREANLHKLNYAVVVKPASSDLDDAEKAEIASDILRYKQKSTNFDEFMQNVNSWNEICGNAFAWSFWDSNEGDYVGNDGDKSYYTGDVNYGILSAFEVYPEDLYKNGISSQRSIIVQKVLHVDEIYNMYGIKVKGSTQHTYSMIPISGAVVNGGEASSVMGIGTVSHEDSQTVTYYFEKPSSRKPHGRLIIICGESDLIYYGNMPYEEIPITHFKCKNVAGHFFGKSVIQDLIPEQRAYNLVMNRLTDYINRAAVDKTIIEEGSIPDIDAFTEDYNLPGKPLYYKRGYSKPDVLRRDSVPGEFYNQITILERRMEQIAGTSQLMVNGKTPSGVTSGTAIAGLKDIDSTRMSLTGDYLRNGVILMAKHWLQIYHRYATMHRTLQITGLNAVGRAITWSKDSIRSYDVELTTVNELELSEEVKMQRFVNLYQMGAFTDSNGAIPQRIKYKMTEAFRLNNFTELLGVNQLQSQAAQRENAFFENGVIPEISVLDDHELHIEEHTRFALQMKYQIIKAHKPEMARAFEEHILMHQAEKDAENAALLNNMKGENING